MTHITNIEAFEKYIIDQINKYKNKEITKTMVFINIRNAPIYDYYNQSKIDGRVFIRYNYRFKFETLCDLLYLNPKLFKYIHRDHPNYYKIYELYKYLTI
jgi:hypothetical protein